MTCEQRSCFATLPRIERGRSVIISGDPKGKNFLYCNGNAVIIRDIQNPTSCDMYSQHAQQTTAARYAPSGFYIASADISGKLRIWDTTQLEHLLKYEYQPHGSIYDLVWSPDSKRIITVGDGKESFASAFLWDSGSSVGQISGHSRPLNCVDYKTSRPFRVATGGEDHTVVFHAGPPFKLVQTLKEHSSFVNTVKFSPNGEKFVSGGSDGRAFIYDGKSGDKIGELGSRAHSGGIYGASWKADSTQLITCSADKSVKLWDANSLELISTIAIGTQLEDQQLGCLWQEDHILSVSLSGYINYLDFNNLSGPIKVVKGHKKTITALTLSEDKQTAFSADFTGLVVYWDVTTGDNDIITGKGHTNMVNAMITIDDLIYTCGVDDTIRTISIESKSYSSDIIKLNSQPRAMTRTGDKLIIVACDAEIVIIKGIQEINSLPVDYEANSISFNDSTSEVAVGSIKNKIIYIYKLDGHNLEEKTKVAINGTPSEVAYSPNGELLAIGDSERCLTIIKTEDYSVLHGNWVFHSSRITCLNWSTDSSRIASGSIDTNIIVWSLENPRKRITMRAAHPQGTVNNIVWQDSCSFISVGADCCVRLWDVKP